MELNQLRRQKGFIPLFIAQFGGALNDNIFRSAILIWIAFHLPSNDAENSATSVALLNNLALILFLFPMIILSPLAGQLADRSNKAAMMRKNKIAEIWICCLATLAFALGWSSLMLFVLFLLGAQAAMFGPNKYAFLSQIMPKRLILMGNAAISIGTFVAITLGALIGGLVAGLDQLWLVAGAGMVAIAYAGYRATCALPEVERGNTKLTLDYNLWRQAFEGIRIARTARANWIAILGISWFWALSSSYLTQLPAYTRYVLGGESSVVAILIACFISGLAIGAYWATRTTDARTEPGLIPLGLIGVIVTGFIFAHISPADTFLQSPGQVFGGFRGQQTALCICLIGFFAGLYLVPQYTMLQQRSGLEWRARLIAANNLLNAIFMIVSSLGTMVVLVVLGWSFSSYFVLLSAASIFMLALLMTEFSQEFCRLIAYFASRVVYKVSIEGKDQIPVSGPAILVCNLTSYADPVILFGNLERPTRFILEDVYYRTPILNWILRGAKTIPVSKPATNKKVFENAESAAVDALRNGELVFVFPEGQLCQNGELAPFKRGVLRILERQPVPVIPVAISGLGGSYFSQGSGRPALSGLPQWKWRRTKVVVRYGAPMDAETLSLETMQQAVADLLADNSLDD